MIHLEIDSQVVWVLIKKMKKIIRLTESDIERIVRKIIKENNNNDFEWTSGVPDIGDYSEIDYYRTNKPSSLRSVYIPHPKYKNHPKIEKSVLILSNGEEVQFPKSNLTSNDFGRDLGKFKFIELFNPNMQYKFPGNKYPQRLVNVKEDEYGYTNDYEQYPKIIKFTFEDLYSMYVNGEIGPQTLFKVDD